MQAPIFYYVNHTSRFQHNSGIQRCVRLLAAALMDAGQPLIPVIWDGQQECFASPSSQALAHLARWNGPAVGAWHPWQPPKTCAQGWLLVVELVCGLRNPEPQQLRAAAPGLQLAWLFHDAIPWQQALRAGCQESDAAQAHARYMQAIASDAVIFCNSRTTRIDLLCFLAEYGKQPLSALFPRVRALPLAQTFPAERLPTPLPKAGPLKLLMVSTLEERKNHLGLIKALVWLQAQGAQHWCLELIGWGANEGVVSMLRRARKLGLPVTWLGGVTDARLHAAYEAADICVYTSYQEGFGLPVAESLWHRRPCLCNSSGALAELARTGGCLMVDTFRWQSIAVGLQQLMEEPQLREELGRVGAALLSQLD